MLNKNRKESFSSVVLSRKVSHSITSAPSYLDYTPSKSFTKTGRGAVPVISAPFSRLKSKIKDVFSFLIRASRRVIFITSVPLYWFLIFKFLIGYFEIGLFMFCVGFSYVLSTLSKDWGVLTWGLKG
jgi:hypothetical protein